MNSLEIKDNKSEQNWLVLMHLSVLIGVSFMPIVGWCVPILMWYFKKDESPYIEKAGLDLFNFLLNIVIFGIIGSLLVVIGVGLLILLVNYLVSVLIPIWAAYKTSKGEHFRYPSFIRFLEN